MKILPTVVLFGGLGIFVPLGYYFVFHHKGNLNKIPARIWAIAGFIAFIFFPIFLFRKHWEKAMVFAKNTFFLWGELPKWIIISGRP